MSFSSLTTPAQFEALFEENKHLFASKLHDYDCAWRVLRIRSLNDQMYIKAKRIRTIQEKGISKIAEGIHDEFIGIANYSLISLIQLELGISDAIDISPDRALALYSKHHTESTELMLKKNHDYGEAWRQMYLESIVDLIIQKILRVHQILDLDEHTKVSEGLSANFQDMYNYALFALIQLKESKE